MKYIIEPNFTPTIEKKAINNCKKIILASDWAVLKAKHKYKKLRKK